MKRITVPFLLILLSFSFSGCSPKIEPAPCSKPTRIKLLHCYGKHTVKLRLSVKGNKYEVDKKSEQLFIKESQREAICNKFLNKQVSINNGEKR